MAAHLEHSTLDNTTQLPGYLTVNKMQKFPSARMILASIILISILTVSLCFVPYGQYYVYSLQSKGITAGTGAGASVSADQEDGNAMYQNKVCKEWIQIEPIGERSCNKYED